MFIFYLTKSIFFHGDVIRGIGEKGLGYSTKRIRFSVRSSSCLYLGLVSIEIYKIKNRVLMGIGRRFGGYELNGLSLRITSCNLRGTNLPKHARLQLVIDKGVVILWLEVLIRLSDRNLLAGAYSGKLCSLRTLEFFTLRVFFSYSRWVIYFATVTFKR